MTGAGDNRVEAALAAQVDYYRQRAAEYHAELYGAAESATTLAGILDALSPRGRCLEIACGTGFWTELLEHRVASLTALDVAPEMIDAARRRLGDKVNLVLADCLKWESPDRFDTVFFGFWLSHVPPQRFAAFWDRLRGYLAPRGEVLFVDTGVGEVRNEELLPNSPVPSVRRKLRDGATHRVIKVFYEPDGLEAQLAAAGWSAQVWEVGERFIVGRARPAPLSGPA